uniref:Uncharacterized protein n=1 Tax=Esox lucius TaxID=8010 RepID=A0A6Q2XCB3_ESOLU
MFCPLHQTELCHLGEVMFQDQLKEKVRPLIDLIDEMRYLGIEKQLNLPAIVVVGDQSSGKSSVLEALSGVALPRGTGIVTRCPLLLQLCYEKHNVWKAEISYCEQMHEFTEPSKVVNYVEEAQNDLAGEGDGICEELITLKIKSNTVCDLTLIDLPGIARVAVKGQPEDIGEKIKGLILNYIKRKETIILVVVPCNVDIATTEALQMAQQVDVEGTRTLAILTKPDLIDPGAENTILDIVHNRTIPLNLGYVIVKCRGQKQIDENMSIIDVMTVFIEKITQLSKGDIITEGNLFVLMRKDYKQWMGILTNSIENYQKHVQEVAAEYDKTHRGSELPGFSNYNVFRQVAQTLLGELVNPAMMTVHSVREMVQKQFDILSKDCFEGYSFLQEFSKRNIESIQDQQSQMAMGRIKEQFEMEMLVYTQDEIFNIQNKLDSETTDYTEQDKRTNYPELLKAYYEIVVQRMGDQVPMLIYYFILKEGAKNVCSEMLSLLYEDDIDKILQEDSCIEMNRAKLKAQLKCLLHANEKLNNL